MHKHFLRLPQISDLTGIKRHTLNARVKSLISDSELERTPGNQICLRPDQVKQIIQNELIYEMGKVIYVGNLKGGVGKTTLAYLLADTLTHFGLKVCAIDLDVQANLTHQFLETNPNRPVFLDLIEGKSTIEDLLVKVNDHLDVIPSSLKNSLLQRALAMQSPKHHMSWFNDLCLNYLRTHYDVIIVDTPPSLTTLNSVFCLCLNQNDTILVPVAPEEFSIIGVQMFLDDVYEIRKSYGATSDLQIRVLMNRFFQTQKSNLEILVKMTSMYGSLFSEAILRDFSKIRELMNDKQCISTVKSGNEIYEFIQGLLVDIRVLKGDENVPKA